MSDVQSYIQDQLKSLDPERYLTCLYLPEAIRHVAMTLYAFDVEISRIHELVSEPIPGEIRIQWWRDLIKSNGNTGSGPLAEALLAVINKYELPREVFDNYLEAKIFDLYQDPMPDLGTYEGYLGETVSCLLNLIAQSAGCDRSPQLADACGHAGVAIGITRHLVLCSRSRRGGQIYFPLPILQKHGLNRDSWLLPVIEENHKSLNLEMIELATSHLNKANIAISELPKDIHTVFLPIIFTQHLLRKLTQNPTDCLKKTIVLSPLKRQWLAFRGVGKL